MDTTNRFVAYWLGYANGKQHSAQKHPLRDTPEYIDYVNLFLIHLNPQTTLNHDFIVTGGISWEQMMEDARFLQARGQKVLASIMSTDSYFWNSIDNPREFAQKAVDLVVGQWGLDGIDIDPEMGNNTIKPKESFIEVVGALREALDSEKLLTFVSFKLGFDTAVLQRNVSLLDYVSLMGYFWGTETYKEEFQKYSKIVPKDKLLIGVNPYYDQETPLEEVKELCRWQSGQGGGGMMLFCTPCDIEVYSGHPEWAYRQTIRDCLKTS